MVPQLPPTLFSWFHSTSRERNENAATTAKSSMNPVGRKAYMMTSKTMTPNTVILQLWFIHCLRSEHLTSVFIPFKTSSYVPIDFSFSSQTCCVLQTSCPCLTLIPLSVDSILQVTQVTTVEWLFTVPHTTWIGVLFLPSRTLSIPSMATHPQQGYQNTMLLPAFTPDLSWRHSPTQPSHNASCYLHHYLQIPH